MATGGVLTEGVSPLQTAYMPEELLAVAREAHNAGRRVATHAIGSDGIKNALRAGIDSIEHGIYLDDEALDLAVASGAYLVPTLSAVNQIVKNGGGGEMPSWVVAKAEMVMEKQRESFKAAVDSGMRIAAGTDAGTPFNRHEDFWMEMKLLVEYGLTPLQAITASTKSAAENMDSAHTVGTIEIGKIADLILVKGDPTQDISVMEKVKLVVKDGEIYRDEISDPLLKSTALPHIALY
jgi:imidazolonepropionase-like amidohydrolase